MNKVVKGVFWSIAQRYGACIIKISVQIVLARLLFPHDFGVIAELMVFVNIAEVLAESGLGVGLIQKKNADELDFSSVFIGGEFFALILYIILFSFAPKIAAFYNEPHLCVLLRVCGLAIFFTTYNSVLNAFLFKRYSVKPMFISTLISVSISGAIAIVMAFKGFGAWALVVQALCCCIMNVSILQLLMKWHPSIGFRYDRFRKIFSFSWKVLFSSILGTLHENLYNLTIGKYYSSTMLGYYNRGNLLPGLVIGQIRAAFVFVTLPLFSEKQEDNKSLLITVRKATRICVMIIFPLAAGIMATSNSLVQVLLTEKWLPCVFFVRIECIYFASLGVVASLGNTITAKGRSDLTAINEILKLSLLLMCMLYLHTKSVQILCVARVAVSVAMVYFTIFISKHIVDYTLKALFSDTVGAFVLSVLMGLIVYSVELLLSVGWWTLIIQVFVGVLVYGVGAFLFMREDFYLIRNLIFKK